MKNLEKVTRQVEAAVKAAGRPAHSVRILAVSKAFDAARVRDLAQQGMGRFGENYLQEALQKQAALTDLDLEWHFIGPIQSNKTRQIADHFSWVHSIDRLKIAERLSTARQDRPPLQVCVQVNISGEASKSGCAPDEARDLCRQIAALPGLQLRGLMAVPAPDQPSDRTRAAYRELRLLQQSLHSEALPMDTLSAGMSGDFEQAIAEGATIVRIGSALFGSRNRTQT